ncbi:MAG: nucleoside monophosphate kinase [Patescibacteria group bacterium]|jgi:adenylate kinase
MTAAKLKTVVILGSQGSGKGTQAKLLAERFGFVHIEVGAILRKKAQEESDEGRNVDAMLKQGILLPFDLVMSLVRAEVAAQPMTTSLVFDGTPRRPIEISYWEKALPEMGRAFTDVLLITLHEQKAIERMSLRAQKEKRDDDTPHAIAERLKNFKESTAPVIDHYRKEGILREINGDQTIDEVHADIVNILDLA